MYKLFLKNVFDKIFAIFLLIIFFPIILVIAVLILIIDRQNFLFSQKRTGKAKKKFTIYKFRTMKIESKIILKNHEYQEYENITKLGLFLRRTSLDELPSLINVLLGDMSFVGPRPLLCEYDKLYNEFHNNRFKVKPGITGFAQINGRNELTWKQRFDFDVEYVENLSFIFDLKILLKTFLTVLLSKGIYSKNKSIMKKFKGY